MLTPRRTARLWLAGLGAGVGLLSVPVLAFVMAICGAAFTCDPGSTGGPQLAAAPGGSASDIPHVRLVLYERAGRRFDLDWAFLASIGAQECNHGSCAGDNGSGCAGPMQIAVRRNSPCSPGNGPTLWERYGVDADHDGHTNPDDPADAIYTAARIFRQAKHAPPAGGTYDQYRQAACAYYGACADGIAAYADTVMRRAVTYGFPTAHHTTSTTLTPLNEPAVGGCQATGPATAAGHLGPVHRAHAPRHLATLPTAITGGQPIQCDARIVPNVIDLARRFSVQVTACFAIHATGGEHPLGAATDLVPKPGKPWPQTTGRLARAIGWKPSCAAIGVAPDCAQPPFRFIGYDGYPGHGDPAHCQPCAGGPHLHLSWQTSASVGQPQAAQRTGHFAPDWIDVYTPTRPEASR